MTSLTRYIVRQLILATLVIAITLASITLLIRSLRLIDYVINRGVTLVSMLEMTLLLVPSILSIILPIAMFAGVLFTYNKLIGDRELVVMRTAGMSQQDLARPAMIVALGMTVLCFIFNLYLSPASYRHFKELQNTYRSTYANVLLQEGRFNTPIEDVTVYVRERGANGEMRGIFVHDNRDRKRPITWMAERGVLQMDPEGPQVVMFNGNRQEMSAENGRLSLVYFDRGSLDLAILEQSLAYRWRDPKERYLGELLFPDDADDEQAHRELVAEGHRRLASPFYAIAFSLIALAALLTGDLNRRGQAGRVVAAVALVAVVQIAGFNAANLAAAHVAGVAVIHLVPLITIAVATYALLRPPRRVRGPRTPVLATAANG